MVSAPKVKPTRRSPVRQPILWRRTVLSIVLHLLVILAAALIGFPFYYMITTSLKTVGEVYTVPMSLWPKVLQWSNFAEVWGMLPFDRFTLNSLIVSCTVTVAKLTMGLTAGYAFGRLRFPKKEALFFVVLATFMIPGEIILIPRFVMLHNLRWVNTYAGLIVPQMSSAFATFLLTEHFRGLPVELFDAAKIDGAGYFRQMWQIAMPISRPIITTLVLLTFVGEWNQYMWPLMVTNSRHMRTLPIGIQEIRSMMEFPEWHLIMAAATIVVLPLLIIFLICQKQFIEGAVQGAIKG